MSFRSTVPRPSDSAGAARLRSVCRLVATAEELEAHYALRRRVFVGEQRLFAADDRDQRDGHPSTLHAIGLIGGRPRGVVRLYPLEPTAREWKGDRLAVLPEYRSNHLGAQLVQFAVATAGSLGGRRMIAHIQLPNVRLFEHLGWRTRGEPARFHGVWHQLMSIELRGEGA